MIVYDEICFEGHQIISGQLSHTVIHTCLFINHPNKLYNKQQRSKCTDLFLLPMVSTL